MINGSGVFFIYRGHSTNIVFNCETFIPSFARVNATAPALYRFNITASDILFAGLLTVGARASR